ncbi:MAG TPA: hypothetical protein VFD19_01270, partial [Clostridia bacterium]|nr:hypothetical protein [Clostridia bacterium]
MTMNKVHDQAVRMPCPQGVLKFAALAMGLVVFTTSLFGCGIGKTVQAGTLATPGKIQEDV